MQQAHARMCTLIFAYCVCAYCNPQTTPNIVGHHYYTEDMQPFVIVQSEAKYHEDKRGLIVQGSVRACYMYMYMYMCVQ